MTDVVDAHGRTVELFAVEYQHQGRRWRPHSIVTGTDTWDAAWSRVHGMLVTASGSGIGHANVLAISEYAKPKALPARIWTSPTVTLERCTGADLRYQRVDDDGLRRMGFKRFRQLPGDPFEDAHGVDGHIVYCSACDDWMGDDLTCDHLRWSDEAGQLIGSGADFEEIERYVTAGLRSLSAAIGAERVARLRRSLEHGRDTIWLDELESLSRHVSDVERRHCRTALEWIATLDSGQGRVMKRAVARSLRILDAWAREEKAARR